MAICSINCCFKPFHILTVGQLYMCAQNLPVSLTLAENCKMEANGRGMSWTHETALALEDITGSGIALAWEAIDRALELKWRYCLGCTSLDWSENDKFKGLLGRVIKTFRLNWAVVFPCNRTRQSTSDNLCFKHFAWGFAGSKTERSMSRLSLT